MKREKLKDLGLNDDQIKEIMSLNGADIKKAKADYDQVVEQNKTLEDQVSGRDKDLKKLQDKLKAGEDATAELDKLREQYKADKQALTDKLSAEKLDFAVDRVLMKNKVRNTRAVKALLNNDEIKFNEDGSLNGLDDQIKNLKKSDSYLFDEGEKQSYEPANGKAAKETKKLNDMTLTERIELKQSDPETYADLVKQSGF